MNQTIIGGTVKREEYLKDEQEMMFQDAKFHSDEDRFNKDLELDYYFKKWGDVRFKIKDQVATAGYIFNVEVSSLKELTKQERANIKNIIDSCIILKGDKVVDSVKSIQKIIKKECNINCGINFINLEKKLEGAFSVNYSGIQVKNSVYLESVENSKIVSSDHNDELMV